MKYLNTIKFSLGELPYGPSATIFVAEGCQFNCYHCLNSDNICNAVAENRTVPFIDLIESLKNGESMFDYIVISGGEPTILGPDLLWHDLFGLLNDLNKRVVLYTNGTNPDAVERALKSGCGDVGVHMDMKLPYHLMDFRHSNEADRNLWRDVLGVNIDWKTVMNMCASLDHVPFCSALLMKTW
jgi:organic radical activating enzyme